MYVRANLDSSGSFSPVTDGNVVGTSNDNAMVTLSVTNKLLWGNIAGDEFVPFSSIWEYVEPSAFFDSVKTGTRAWENPMNVTLSFSYIENDELRKKTFPRVFNRLRQMHPEWQNNQILQVLDRMDRYCNPKSHERQCDDENWCKMTILNILTESERVTSGYKQFIRTNYANFNANQAGEAVWYLIHGDKTDIAMALQCIKEMQIDHPDERIILLRHIVAILPLCLNNVTIPPAILPELVMAWFSLPEMLDMLLDTNKIEIVLYLEKYTKVMRTSECLPYRLLAWIYMGSTNRVDSLLPFTPVFIPPTVILLLRTYLLECHSSMRKTCFSLSHGTWFRDYIFPDGLPFELAEFQTPTHRKRKVINYVGMDEGEKNENIVALRRGYPRIKAPKINYNDDSIAI